MWPPNLTNQGDFAPKQRNRASRRQSLLDWLIKIGNQYNCCLCNIVGLQKADATRLDHAADRGGTGRDHLVTIALQQRAVIRHQHAAQPHQDQPKGRFATT